MYDLTKNIVGNEANMDLMVPAVLEQHDYEPSAKDMQKLEYLVGLTFRFRLHFEHKVSLLCVFL